MEFFEEYWDSLSSQDQLNYLSFIGILPIFPLQDTLRKDSMNEFINLSGLMGAQRCFESQIIGEDGNLSQYNTPEFILTRGVMGEAEECLDAVLKGDLDQAKVEAADVLIFLASLYNHFGMSPEEVSKIAYEKMQSNFQKYQPQNFENRTVAEGIDYSRLVWSLKQQE